MKLACPSQAAALCCALIGSNGWTMASAQQVTIGVLAFEGAEQTKARWDATASYLTEQVPPYRFLIEPLNRAQLDRRVNNGTLGFVLTNPGNYVGLESSHGVSRIATLVTARGTRTYTEFSSVIFARTDSSIESIDDIRNRPFAAVGPGAFGGFQLARWTLHQAGYDPLDGDANMLWLGLPQQQIVDAVLDRRADVGTVRTGVLEAMARRGEIELSELRVLALRQHDDLPYLHSTLLVPEWPFAKTAHTPIALARDVAIALFRLSPNHQAAIDAGIAGWTIPLDYSVVHTILRELGVQPYQERPMTFARVWNRYRIHLLAILVLIASLAGFLVYYRYNNRRLADASRILEREIERRCTAQQALARHRDQLEQTIAGHTAQLQRAEEERHERRTELAHFARLATAGELVGGLAHELNQPLTAALNYTNGCLRRLALPNPDAEALSDGMSQTREALQRAAEVMVALKRFLRKDEVSRESVLLEQQVEVVLDLMGAEIRRRAITVTAVSIAGLPPAAANAIQVQQVLANLLMNALESFDQRTDVSPPQIRIEGGLVHDGIRVCVTDNAAGLPTDVPHDSLFDSFRTTKPQGMGMGLSISRRLVEAHNGQLSLDDAPGGGAIACFTLPRASRA